MLILSVASELSQIVKLCHFFCQGRLIPVVFVVMRGIFKKQHFLVVHPGMVYIENEEEYWYLFFKADDTKVTLEEL